MFLQNFVAEVISLYFEDSVVKIEKMFELASSSAFNELDQICHQFKGSSASLGKFHMLFMRILTCISVLYLLIDYRFRCSDACKSVHQVERMLPSPEPRCESLGHNFFSILERHLISNRTLNAGMFGAHSTNTSCL